MTSFNSYPHMNHRALVRNAAGISQPRWLQAIREFAERVWGSNLYSSALVMLATLALCAGQATGGCVAMVGVASFMLVFCSDIFAALLPMLLFSLLTTAFYDNMGILLQYWPVFVIAIASLFAHLRIYAAPITKGAMTRPLMAVSAATLLGGIGSISAREYFAPVSIYYMLGLGGGMLLVYMGVRSQLQIKRNYDVLERFLSILYYAGVFAGLVIGYTYLTHLSEFMRSGSVIYMSYRNFCTTVLLLALPAACISAPDGSTRWFSIAFLYVALLMSGSRSGLLFGTGELICCLLWLYRSCHTERIRAFRIVALITVPAAVVAMVLLIPYLFSSRMTDGALISMGESRVTFFLQALKDFASNPLVGIGLGNMSNQGIFIGVSGSIVWYHNLFAQILGSMGLVGVAAFGWHYFTRIKLLLSRQSAYLPLAAISIAGMVLVSMTNPGEFCPLPNEFVMVALFAVIEQLPMRKRNKIKQ